MTAGGRFFADSCGKNTSALDFWVFACYIGLYIRRRELCVRDRLSSGIPLRRDAESEL